jgi:rhamnogalacturonyl hydrolase YesR
MKNPLAPLFQRALTGLAACVIGTVSQLPAAPTADQVLTDMKRVADWQLANPSKHAVHDWTQAPFFLGLSALHHVSRDSKYLDALTGFGRVVNFGPGPRVTHADDHAVLQAWLEIHRRDHDYTTLRPAIAHFDTVTEALKGKPAASISGGNFTWCWCDALFMSPPVWAQLSQVTGNPKFLEWADREWWTTTDVLYDPTHKLYYRDNNFFKRTTPSGRKVFWARGNGWVVGGLVHMLDYLPADHPSRERYLGLYHDMMRALLKLQNADGLWRTSLLDPEDPVGESSGSAFFTYALAWGVNRGLLKGDEFREAALRGWSALANNIQPSGMLGFVQRIDDRPNAAGAENTEVYGSGALLLAGAEIIRHLDPSKRRKDVAGFEGVVLPEGFMPATPRVRARFVPERSDDFAWENDLIAFRTYGPALRQGTEDSGFDAWFKRVPYPVMDKWYIEDRIRLPYGNVNKSYHEDQGEGYDAYKVGDSRGCGAISLWHNGKLHNSNTFIAHRIIDQSPERAAFELDYASEIDGRILRETKRITIVMGKRLFQCDSRFTLDGKPATFEVGIGLMPQSPGTTPDLIKDQGVFSLWETFDGYGLGTAIVVDPARVVKTLKPKDPDTGGQALCIAKTDENGHIRWFAGFGWAGQGTITSKELWHQYLEGFSKVHLKEPIAEPSFEVHPSPVPAPAAAEPAANP